MIFVSHKETDTALAKALLEFLRASLDLPDAQFRCTSVPGFQLPFGKTISSQLKDDIGASNAVFALMTRASRQSAWVLFELGAAWALGRVTVPILGPGLSESDLPGPLPEYPAIKSDDTNAAARLCDAVAQISRELELTEKTGGERQSALASFMVALKEWAPTNPLETKRAVAFQLSWLLVALAEKHHADPIVEGEVEAHARELGLRLPPTWRESVVANDLGQAFNDFFNGLGGQLAARQPQLVSCFEAGFNLPLAASRKDHAVLQAAISGLDLPNGLRAIGEDPLAWANRVHDHFQSVVRARAG